MNVPRFSILIPTTGRAELVRTALASVLHQRFQDFEVVIADSKRSDETRRVAEAPRDPRIRYVRTPEGGGAFIPWDFAPTQARGEYLLWLDDDNYLLPFALEVLDGAIRRSGADIVTASHIYYYDSTNPRLFLRDCFGIVPFRGGEHRIDLREAITRLFGFARGGTVPWPRFHYSELAVSRAVAERVRRRLGFVLFTDGHYTHSMQPILFAFARSCFFIDWPIVIVGRLGVSMSQSWSTAARPRFARDPFRPRLSPVSAYTRINIVLENYLRVKELLPDLLGDVPIGLERFAEIHLRELAYLDTGLRTAIRNWREMFALLRRLAPGARHRLRASALRLALRAPFVYAGRRLGLHKLSRAIRGFPTLRGKERLSAAEKLQGAKEFTVPFKKEDHIDSIAAFGLQARDVLLREIGMDIERHPYAHHAESAAHAHGQARS